MNARCRCIEHLILRPTLRLLDAESDTAVTLLLGTGLAETGFGSPQAGRYGFFAMSAAHHRSIWDDYLAFLPERASRTRSLASPVAFLQNPDAELDRNPAYATAIAWIAYEASGVQLPPDCPSQTLAGIWRDIYHAGEPLGRAGSEQCWREVAQDAA